jgi:hypothetical protein
MRPHHINPLTGEDDFAVPQVLSTSGVRLREPAERINPDDPGDLGQSQPQRRLPLWVGQEVQTLPRRIGVRGGPSLNSWALLERNQTGPRIFSANPN